jgi:hypothetical protein
MKNRAPLLGLEEEDLELVQRLVLASGSIKELAETYGVSYPTMRSRLDRVIEHLQGALAARPVDPMAELLAGQVEKGEVTPRAARAVLELHRKKMKKES